MVVSFILKFVSFRLPEADDPSDIANKTLFKVEYEDGDIAEYCIDEIAPLLIPLGPDFLPLRRAQ